MRAREAISSIVGLTKATFPQVWEGIDTNRQKFIHENMPKFCPVYSDVVGVISKDMQFLFALAQFFGKYNPYSIDLNKVDTKNQFDKEYYQTLLTEGFRAHSESCFSVFWILLLRQQKYKKLEKPGFYFLINHGWRVCHIKETSFTKEERLFFRNTRLYGSLDVMRGHLACMCLLNLLEYNGLLPSELK